MSIIRRSAGFSYLGTGVGIGLFVFQESRKFDESQLASTYFLLDPLFLSLSIPLVLGGAAWMFLSPSEIANRRVRWASLWIGAVIALAGLVIFLSAITISPSFAHSLQAVLVPVSGLFSIWILSRSFFGPKGIS